MPIRDAAPNNLRIERMLPSTGRDVRTVTDRRLIAVTAASLRLPEHPAGLTVARQHAETPSATTFPGDVSAPNAAS